MPELHTFRADGGCDDWQAVGERLHVFCVDTGAEANWSRENEACGERVGEIGNVAEQNNSGARVCDILWRAMPGDIEFQVWTLLAYARPNFFEQPFERITIGGIFEIAEEENAFAVFHLGHGLRQRCDYRQMFGGQARDQIAKVLMVGFGDV